MCNRREMALQERRHRARVVDGRVTKMDALEQGVTHCPIRPLGHIDGHVARIQRERKRTQVGAARKEGEQAPEGDIPERPPGTPVFGRVDAEIDSALASQIENLEVGPVAC